MPHDQMQVLLDELLESHSTPEELCGTCPELLPELRDRWHKMQRVQADLDALFPSPAEFSDRESSADHVAELPQVPGYDVQGVLGRGGMGVVFRARQRSLNRVVAIKMVIAGAYASLHDRERFQREAEAVAVLKHPNIVQIHDVGQTGGRPYFTMEFVEDGSLAQKLAGTPQPARQAAALVATLAEAVESAHRCGVVHRDLKPANILIAADGAPKISDFGLARRVDEGRALTRSGATIGTPGYMAPEQAQMTPVQIGPAADIYALGAILYEMVTGRPPFRAESAAETIQQVLAHDPVPPSRLNSNVPRDLETICLRCLQKEPRLRYGSAAALAGDLQRFLRGEAILARPEGRAGRLVRRIRRQPLQSALMAGIALLATILIGGAVWLVSDRAAAARTADAELVAIEQAVELDLQGMVRSLQNSAWPEARAAAERANVRLGTLELPALRKQLDQGLRDLKLAEELDVIRLTGSETIGGVFRLEHSDQRYEETFIGAGLGSFKDRPNDVAARVAASHVRDALLTALDHWSVCRPSGDQRRHHWILEVARKADPDQSPWRVRARDPEVRKDQAALAELIATAPIEQPSVSLFLALERDITDPSFDHTPFLKRIQAAHPNDYWINHRLGNVLCNYQNWSESIRYYQAALAIRPGTAPVYCNLASTLAKENRFEESLENYRRAVALDPTSRFFQLNFAVGLSNAARHDELIEKIPVAIRMNPQSAMLHTALAISLDAKQRDAEALAEHEVAVQLEPQRSEAQRELRKFLMSHERWEETKVAWQKAIEANPDVHNAYYGYAEFCLFRGDVEEYRRVRQSMLTKFSNSPTNQTAERTARAALLWPASSQETHQAGLLAAQVASVEKTREPRFYPYFQFVRGLAEYRQGRFEDAINTMRGDATKVLGAAPDLVIAMSQHQLGKLAEARQALAAAIPTYDWDTNKARDQDAWINHILRREADAMILADPPSPAP